MAIQMTGWLLWRTLNGKWKYTSAVMEREEAGVLVVEEHIRRLQKMVAQYIATRSLLELCEGLERAPWAQVGLRWCEHVVIDLAGAREAGERRRRRGTRDKSDGGK